jgi:hypothetical protein
LQQAWRLAVLTVAAAPCHHQTIAREQQQGTIALETRMRMMVSAKNNKSEKLGSAV